MFSLKYIKNRIRGVNSTKKITQAMKIVAVSSLKKIQKNICNSYDYIKILQDLLINIQNLNCKFYEKNIFSKCKNNKNKTLFIVISSDRGLCGSFNSKIFNQVKNEIESNKKVKVFCIGNKLINYMRLNYRSHIVQEMPFFKTSNKKICYNKLILISKMIKKIFIKEKFHECKIIYTEFHSIVKQNIKKIQILPLEINQINKLSKQSKKTKNFNRIIYGYEGDLEIILEQIVNKYMSALFFNIHLNSLSSEYSARMLAMDSATQNAKRMLRELSLFYNRSRQSIITKELTEIISGAEAIN